MDEGVRLKPIGVGGRKDGLGIANGCRIDIMKQGSTEVEGEIVIWDRVWDIMLWRCGWEIGFWLQARCSAVQHRAAVLLQE